MTLLLALFLASACIASVFLSSIIVRRYPIVGFVICYAVLLTAWEFPTLQPLATIGGSNIFAPDLVAALLAIVAFTRMKHIKANLASGLLPWCGIGALLLISLMRGISEFGLGVAVNEGRILLVPFAVITWGLSLDWHSSDLHTLLFRPLRVLGWMLVILSLYHAGRYGIGSATSAFIDVNGIEQSSRVLTQMQAFVLVLASLAALKHWLSDRFRLAGVDFFVFTGIIALTQQRTVWAAYVVSLIIYFLLGTAKIKLKVSAIALVIVFFGFILFSSGSGAPLLKDLTDSLSSRSTYEARTGGWEQLVNNVWASGIETVLWGQPFGSGFERVESNGLTVHYSPHNWYVLLLLRIGILGLLLYICFLGRFLLLGIARKQAPLPLAVLVGVSVFCWAYGISWTFGAIFAWAVVAGQGTLSHNIPLAKNAALDLATAGRSLRSSS